MIPECLLSSCSSLRYISLFFASAFFLFLSNFRTRDRNVESTATNAISCPQVFFSLTNFRTHLCTHPHHAILLQSLCLSAIDSIRDAIIIRRLLFFVSCVSIRDISSIPFRLISISSFLSFFFQYRRFYSMRQIFINGKVCQCFINFF